MKVFTRCTQAHVWLLKIGPQKYPEDCSSFRDFSLAYIEKIIAVNNCPSRIIKHFTEFFSS